jgi:glycosyltransferase involved in cell wall biosynthesis
MISLVIPAYNEEKRIAVVLEVYSEFLNSLDDYEIIVVADGTDNTAGIVRTFMKSNSKIKLFEYPRRLGKGGAVIEGFKKATGDLIGFVDSDLSVKPDDYKKLIEHVLTGGDCAIASRSVSGSRVKIKPSMVRTILSSIFNLLVKLSFSLYIEDTQCGAKMFKQRVIKEVIPQMRAKGFEFDVELLWRIKKRGYTIKEIPVSWEHCEDSKFSLKFITSMFASLLLRRLGL